MARYANALSTMEGLTPCYLADGTDVAAAYLADPYACVGYRLPTEAEWEYAAKSGEDTRYSGSNSSTTVAWTGENAYAQGTCAHDVATLASNGWGLDDMTGNVWEWTQDWYDGGYGGYADGTSDVDPAGPATGSDEGHEGSARVFRGGDWYGGAAFAAVSSRYFDDPATSTASLGFRLARSAAP